MANAKFNYGFEYLGVQDKLVQTPLTDRCYLTMTQALEGRLGGSPFGKNGEIYHKLFGRILQRGCTRRCEIFFTEIFASPVYIN